MSRLWRHFFKRKSVDRSEMATKQDKVKGKQGKAGDQELWVHRVRSFSSQYNDSSWKADMIIGPPKVYPRYGDIPGTWAQGRTDSSQFIELEYNMELFIQGIDIYETFHSGGVTKISSLDKSGRWQVLWKTDRPENLELSRVFSPEIKQLHYKTACIRLDVNCTAASTWVEIDAVKICGRQYHTALPPGVGVLQDDLRTLVNNPSFSDVTFTVEGKNVHAHRAILMARSDYFRAMFCDGLKESKSPHNQPIALKAISHAAFLSLLLYLYTSSIDANCTTSHLIELMRVGDFYREDGLRALALHEIEKVMDVDNVVQFLREATESEPILEEVREMCFPFIQQNMHAVSKTPYFEDLPQDVMLYIIQNATANLSIKQE